MGSELAHQRALNYASKASPSHLHAVKFTFRSLQEITGLEVTSLIEDPEHASVRQIVDEVLSSQQPGGGGADASAAAAGSSAVQAQHVASPWISPAPVTVKMRLFCLPYAGGISENVYSRCGMLCVSAVKAKTTCTEVEQHSD